MPVLPSTSEKAGALNSGIILLVEDEEILLGAVAKMLRKQGYSVLTASNGTEAVDLLRLHNSSVSLVLLDVSLPGLSSREVLLEARRQRLEMPIILTSALAENVVEPIFADLSIERFIRKPYRLAELVNVLNDSLPRS
jgi:DNA-binding response OmpR family regulator